MYLLLLSVLAVHTAITPGVVTEEIDEPLKAVADSTGKFSSDFLRVMLEKNPGNLVSSPLSAAAVLAMAAYGAGGNTAAQMKSGLHLPSDDAIGKSGFESLVTALYNVKNVELHFANKIYAKTNVDISPEYRAITTTSFKTDTEQVDFKNASAAVEEMNSWCAKLTNNRINNILKLSDIEDDTALVLINGMYFKGTWQFIFHPDLTKARPFHINETTAIDVPTMCQSEWFKYGELPELKAKYIELPYMGEEFSMIIVLPDDINGLNQLRQNVQQLDWNELINRSVFNAIELSLPKFKIQNTIDLKEVLEELGMTDMFSYGIANFSGMAHSPLKVSKVVQKSFIEINEGGTEADSVSGLLPFPVSARPEEAIKFQVDRPFLAIIRYNRFVVFQAVVCYPEVENDVK